MHRILGARESAVADIRPALQQRYALHLATLSERGRVEQLMAWGTQSPGATHTQKSLRELWDISQAAVSKSGGACPAASEPSTKHDARPIMVAAILKQLTLIGNCESQPRREPSGETSCADRALAGAPPRLRPIAARATAATATAAAVHPSSHSPRGRHGSEPFHPTRLEAVSQYVARKMTQAATPPRIAALGCRGGPRHKSKAEHDARRRRGLERATSNGVEAGSHDSEDGKCEGASLG